MMMMMMNMMMMMMIEITDDFLTWNKTGFWWLLAVFDVIWRFSVAVFGVFCPSWRFGQFCAAYSVFFLSFWPFFGVFWRHLAFFLPFLPFFDDCWRFLAVSIQPFEQPSSTFVKSTLITKGQFLLILFMKIHIRMITFLSIHHTRFQRVSIFVLTILAPGSLAWKLSTVILCNTRTSYGLRTSRSDTSKYKYM